MGILLGGGQILQNNGVYDIVASNNSHIDPNLELSNFQRVYNDRVLFSFTSECWRYIKFRWNF